MPGTSFGYADSGRPSLGARSSQQQQQQQRYSFPLFCNCDYDTIIEPMVDPAPGIEPGTYKPTPCGDHLFAQTIHTFRYLQQRVKNGELQLPESSREVSSFGKLREVL